MVPLPQDACNLYCLHVHAWPIYESGNAHTPTAIETHGKHLGTQAVYKW